MQNFKNATTEEAYDSLKSRGILPEGLSLIKFEMSTCTFKRKLTFKEIGLTKDVESKLASLGSKKVLDPEKPKEFRNCKEQGETALAKIGVRFSRYIWAVPTIEYSTIYNQLLQIQKRAIAIKNDIIMNLDEYVEEFAQLADTLEPGFGDHIRNGSFKRDYLQGQLQCIVEGAEEMELSLSHKVEMSVAEKATDYYNQLEKQRIKYNRTTFELTKNTRNKLEEILGFIKGMAFIDSSVEYMGVLIEKYLATYPAHYSQGTAAHNKGLVQLLVNLMSPEKVRLLAEDDDSFESQKPSEIGETKVNTVSVAEKAITENVTPVSKEADKILDMDNAKSPEPISILLEDDSDKVDLAAFGFSLA